MPTTAIPVRPDVTSLTAQERQVLQAAGCGLCDAEIAELLALPEAEVTRLLGRVLAALTLPDRAAAIVHAFDCGLVRPGHGPRRRPAPQPGRRAAAAPGAALRLTLLGPPQAWVGERAVDLGPLRQQAVLAALALAQGGPVSRRHLLDEVWGTEPPEGNVVPVYVYRLRKLLGGGDNQEPVIGRERGGYRIAGGRIELDVTQLESLAGAAEAAVRAGYLTEAVRRCAEALALFRGEPLAGLPGPAAELERLRLGRRRTALVRQKADCQLRLGQAAEAIAELSALAEAEPLDEPLAALLMEVLNRHGRQAEALAVFTRTRCHLADRLGVLPGPQLRRAHQAVLAR